MATRIAAGITLSGAAYGGEITGSPARLNNDGNIAGTAGVGVILQGGGNVYNAFGGTIAGTTLGVYIGGGDDAGKYVSYSKLGLAAYSYGTLSGLGTQFVGLGQAVVDTGANWTPAGANTLAASYVLTNQGTLINNGTVTGSLTLAPGAILSNPGKISIPGITPVAGRFDAI